MDDGFLCFVDGVYLVFTEPQAAVAGEEILAVGFQLFVGFVVVLSKQLDESLW